MPESDPGFAPQPEYILKNQCFTAERGFGMMLGGELIKSLNYVIVWDMDLAELGLK